MAKLIVKAGTPQAQEFELKPGKNFIGRGFANDFKLDDASVSGSHAVVTMNGGIVTVTDLGSTNGTRINQLPATGSPLQSGHVVKLGAVEMLFVGDALAAPMPPSIASPPPASPAAAQIATEFIIRQPSHVGVTSAPAPAPVPQSGSVSIPRPIPSTAAPPPAPVPQGGGVSIPQPMASAPLPSALMPQQGAQISIPRPVASAQPPAPVLPADGSRIPSAAPQPTAPAPAAPVPIMIPPSTAAWPPAPTPLAPTAPPLPPPVPIMATSAAEAPLPPGGGLKFASISHARPSPVVTAPAPAADPAMQPASAPPVAAGMVDAPPGKVACKFHKNTSGEWLCQKCVQLFCSLCVSNRPTPAGIAYFCRTCGTQCVQVRIKAIAKKKEKQLVAYSEGTVLLRTVSFGLGGAAVAGGVWAGFTAATGFDMPAIFAPVTGGICGYAVKIASQDRPGGFFSLMAIVATLLGIAFGLGGAILITGHFLFTINSLAIGVFGLIFGIFIAWKVGGGDF